MRAVVQRVTEAAVSVRGERVAGIGPGMLVLLGVAEGDGPQDARYVGRKLAGLRIFDDEDGLLNLSVCDVGGGVLLVSQFTLLGDCRKGRRPSFAKAAGPEAAVELYEAVADELRARRVPTCTGQFRTAMHVSLVNDGPVTLLLDSRKEF